MFPASQIHFNLIVNTDGFSPAEKTEIAGLVDDVSKMSSVEILTFLRLGTAAFSIARNASLNADDKHAIDAIHEHYQTRLKSMESTRDILQSAVSEIKDAASNSMTNSTLAHFQNTIAELRKDLQFERDRSHALLMRKSNSSIKGADNEAVFAEMLVNAFGMHKDFEFFDKKLNSGDHVMRCNGIVFMFENKCGYARGVPKTEIAKAHADFERNQECDVLVMISSDSKIMGKDRPGHIDFEFVAGRPVLYIGHFGSQCMDQTTFMSSIVMPICSVLHSARLHMANTSKSSLSTDALNINLTNAIEDIKVYVDSMSTRVKGIINELNALERTIKTNVAKVKTQISSLGVEFETVSKIIIDSKGNF
jgi:hypothetical protein